MYYTYYFQGMVFEEEEIEKDPKEAFLSYSKKFKNIDYLNDFHKKYVDESLSEFDERLHFEIIDGEAESYDDETGEPTAQTIDLQVEGDNIADLRTTLQRMLWCLSGVI